MPTVSAVSESASATLPLATEPTSDDEVGFLTSTEQAPDEVRTESTGVNSAKVMVVSALVAVLFFFGLLVAERIPEIPVDIDFKPFFIPFLFLALLPRGLPSLGVAVGAAIGEGIGDVLEGYEIDDPIGFVGYVVGFVVAAYLIKGQPLSWVRVGLACIAGAGVQAVIEASSFLIFGEEGLTVTATTAAGNTVTHGIVMGAIITIPLVRVLHGRIERLLGFTPQQAS